MCFFVFCDFRWKLQFIRYTRSYNKCMIVVFSKNCDKIILTCIVSWVQCIVIFWSNALTLLLWFCAADLPTCLLCVCLTGSVYCEEVSPDMTAIPTLPKETAYLYARFNKIKKITNQDFAEIGKVIRNVRDFQCKSNTSFYNLRLIWAHWQKDHSNFNLIGRPWWTGLPWTKL